MSKIKDFIYGREEGKPKFDLSLWNAMEYNDMMYIIAKSISDYRDIHHITQKELADLLGCSRKQIANLESGNMEDISLRTIITMWNKLSTPDNSFAVTLLAAMSNRARENYEILRKRRWE